MSSYVKDNDETEAKRASRDLNLPHVEYTGAEVIPVKTPAGSEYNFNPGIPTPIFNEDDLDYFLARPDFKAVVKKSLLDERSAKKVENLRKKHITKINKFNKEHGKDDSQNNDSGSE